MSILSRALLILALLAVSTIGARTDGLSISGGLNAGFPGGLTNFAGVAAVSPTGFLLINTGSVMLISTVPSKFKIQ